jgi:hypothetical protein
MYLLKKYFKKEVLCTWTIISIYYKICKKNCSKIHLYEKVIFVQKEMQSYYKVTSLADSISFAWAIVQLVYNLDTYDHVTCTHFHFPIDIDIFKLVCN